MASIGEPIDDAIPNVVMEETARPGEPGFGWTLSDQALREMASIDESRRLAAAKAASTLLD